MPFAPSSFLLLAVRPGATSSVRPFLVAMPLLLVELNKRLLFWRYVQGAGHKLHQRRPFPTIPITEKSVQ